MASVGALGGNNGVPNPITVNNGGSLADINGHGNWDLGSYSDPDDNPKPANQRSRAPAITAGSPGQQQRQPRNRIASPSPGRQREHRRTGNISVGKSISDTGNGYTLTSWAPGHVLLGSGDNLFRRHRRQRRHLADGQQQQPGLLDDSRLTVNGGVLDINGKSPTVGGVILTSGSIVNSGTTAAALTGTSYTVQSGLISAVLAGGSSVSLTKTTGGVVTLSGNNTYLGNTDHLRRRAGRQRLA